MGALDLFLTLGAIHPYYAPGRSKLGGAKGPPKATLAPPCSNLRPFESKCTALKKVFVTLLGRYGAPCSDSVPQQWFGACTVIPLPGNCASVAHPPALRPCYHADVLRNHRLHCTGVTKGERGHIYPGAESLWGAESLRGEPKIPSLSHVRSSMQYICFRKISGSNMGAPKLLLAPGAI